MRVFFLCDANKIDEIKCICYPYQNIEFYNSYLNTHRTILLKEDNRHAKYQ